MSNIYVRKGYKDRKDYLRQMIFEYFRGGEVNLGGIIKRIDSDNFNDNERASEETIENINNFFKNELLVALSLRGPLS